MGGAGRDDVRLPRDCVSTVGHRPVDVSEVPDRGHARLDMCRERTADDLVEVGVAQARQLVQGAVPTVPAQVDMRINQPRQQGAAPKVRNGAISRSRRRTRLHADNQLAVDQNQSAVR
jgi:hypothetical protein